MERLKREFYNRDTLTVARELLGTYLVHASEEGKTVGKIVEVEAYIGPDDAASHAYKGLNSKRTKVQFGPGGYAYIYLIYGMYHCFNVVTNLPNHPEVVLIRALEPVMGLKLIKKRKGTNKLASLCNGPGKLCKSMGIRKEHYGTDLCGDRIYISRNIKSEEAFDIEETKRININYAGKDKDLPWRFIIKGNSFVSK